MTYFDIQQFTDELEQALGPMPKVASARTIFERVERLARQAGTSLPDPHEVTRALFQGGALPCRLPDGSLGYFNVNHPDPREAH